MQHGALFLDALVVAAAHDPAVENQHRANGDATGFEAGACFRDGRIEKGIHPVAS
jgi:hypothetical protein